MKEGGTFGANPAKGVFEVFDDAGQLRFGSQTVIDRNDGIACAEHHFFDAIGDATAGQAWPFLEVLHGQT